MAWRAHFYFFTAMVYAVICAVSLMVLRPRIEHDLMERTGRTLVERGVRYASIRFAGRDGRIEVRGGTAQGLQRIQQLAQSVFGVRIAQVISLPEIAPQISARKLEGNRLMLSGRLPSADGHRAWLTSARQLFGDANVTSQIQVSDEVSDSPYLEHLRPMLELLMREAALSHFEFQGKKVHLYGEVATQAERERLEGDASEIVPGDLELLSYLTVRAPSSEAAPVDTQTAPAVPASEPGAMLDSQRLHFEYDSVKLTDRSKVKEIAAILEKSPEVRLKIVGFCDIKGSAPYNQKLSERRAAAVRRALIQRGISADRLEVEGRGATAFIADNSTDAGRAQNRRVEFEVTKGFSYANPGHEVEPRTTPAGTTVRQVNQDSQTPTAVQAQIPKVRTCRGEGAWEIHDLIRREIRGTRRCVSAVSRDVSESS